MLPLPCSTQTLSLGTALGSGLPLHAAGLAIPHLLLPSASSLCLSFPTLTSQPYLAGLLRSYHF